MILNLLNFLVVLISFLLIRIQIFIFVSYPILQMILNEIGNEKGEAEIMIEVEILKEGEREKSLQRKRRFVTLI